MNIPTPSANISSVQPFIYSMAQVNRIVLVLSAYIFFFLYPAYGLLRGWWMGDFSSFSVGCVWVVIATAVAFGFFARVTMLKYLTVDDKPDNAVPD